MVERRRDDSFLRVVHRVREHHLKNDDYSYSPTEIKLVRLAEKYSDENLLKKFNPKGTLNDFYKSIKTDEFSKRIAPFIEETVKTFLDTIRDLDIPVYIKKAKYSNLYEEDRVVLCSRDTGAVFNFHRLERETRYWLTMRHGTEHLSLLHRDIILLVNEPCRMLYQNRLYYFDDISGNKLMPFHEKEYISIPEKIEDKYYSTFILNAIATQEVVCSGFTINEGVPEKSAILAVEIDISASPVFILSYRYDNRIVAANDETPRVVSLSKRTDGYHFNRICRDAAWEQQLVALLHQTGLEGSPCAMKLSGQKSDLSGGTVYEAVTWLSEHAEWLKSNAIEMEQERLDQKYFIGRQELKISVSNRLDWFDIHASVKFGEFEIPFVRLKRYILGGIREYKLPNGKIAILPEEWFSRFREIMNFGKSEENHIRLNPSYFMLLIESGIDTGEETKQRLEALSGEKLEKQIVPESLQAQLRPYQQQGYDWMYHLYRQSMGGVLADDMGLGKTLQALTLLLRLKRKSESLFFDHDGEGQLSLFGDGLQPVENRQSASLIVLPVSLVHNWENEIRKFAPSLKVYCYTGARRREKTSLSGIVSYYDIILTTYGTVRNDVDLLSLYPFFYLILDEGQYIKNPESKTYQAIISLQAQHRLVLTGTPIENSLSDLWAQINFLNRGHLGSLPFFRTHPPQPTEQTSDAEKGAQLHKLIRPFILRRTKEEVAGDLPPLTEEVLAIEMTPEQKSVYEEEKSAVRNMLMENIREEGFEKSTFAVLQALTRLRQIAIHPRMVMPESEAESGKFNEIIAMLKILVAENHKILLFSSFVKHLKLLSARFDKENWGYSLLTGATVDRKEVIDDFQSNPTKNIFLISLKAGGVGLNLTSADYIFIVDPWWNPAAEMQAVSRAHRIGQEKKVFVYRFISEETIEEKILLLKERKSALASEFINSENPLKYVTQDEVMKLFE